MDRERDGESACQRVVVLSATVALVIPASDGATKLVTAQRNEHDRSGDGGQPTNPAMAA